MRIRVLPAGWASAKNPDTGGFHKHRQTEATAASDNDGWHRASAVAACSKKPPDLRPAVFV
jgi:hypothetical protein